MTSDVPSLNEIVDELRAYRGITRKKSLRQLADIFPEGGNILAARGEDAAAISLGEEIVVLAADGIMEELIEKDPEWAGYCSILVNVNDVLAMRAHPIAAVNVISAVNDEMLNKMLAGIKKASDKLNTPVVGGHLHPNASHNDISAAIMGRVNGKPLLSSTALPGDRVVVISDLNGQFTTGVPYSWDCTSMKGKESIAQEIDLILRALTSFTSCKDVSNPGLLGTLGMLLEASRTGAEVHLERIPMPEGVNLLQWLKAYQGLGMVGTAKANKLDEINGILEGSDLVSGDIGYVVDEPFLSLLYSGERRVLFDFSREDITGLFRRK